MKKPENIFTAFTILLLGIFALTLITFGFGLSRQGHQPISGLRTLGGAIAEEAGKETMQIFKVNDEFAYFVDTSYIEGMDYLALMKFEKTGYPLSFACGAYQGGLGPIVTYPFVQGDYAYRQNLGDVWYILHIPTGEVTEVQNLSDFTKADLDPNATAITAEWVESQGYKELPYQKESCVSITLAEIILIVVSLIGMGVIAFTQRKKQS